MMMQNALLQLSGMFFEGFTTFRVLPRSSSLYRLTVEADYKPQNLPVMY